MAKAVIIYLVRQQDNAVKLQGKAADLLPHVIHTDITIGDSVPDHPNADQVIDRRFYLRDEPATRIQVLVAIQPEVREQIVDVVQNFAATDEVTDRVLDWTYIRYGSNHLGKTEAEIAALADTYARRNLCADKTWAINQNTPLPATIVPEFG